MIESFRTLGGFSLLCIGGKVEERSRGDRGIMDGRSDRGLGECNEVIESCRK